MVALSPAALLTVIMERVGNLAMDCSSRGQTSTTVVPVDVAYSTVKQKSLQFFVVSS